MTSDELALRRILAARSNRLLSLPNVVGTGIGNRRRGGAEVDELCVCVLVSRKVPRSDLSDDEAVPVELSVPGYGSCPTDILEIGAPRFLTDHRKYRPVEGGCSMITLAALNYGTLGGVAFDELALEPAWVTCRHVAFPARQSPYPGRTFAYQPGDHMNDNHIGEARDWAPMEYRPAGGAPQDYPINPVDAAKGDFHAGFPPGVAFEVLDVGPAIFDLAQPERDLPVWKHGCATGPTKGRISHFIEDPPPIFPAHFDPSISARVSSFLIESDGELPFGDGGDSGSIVFTQERAAGGWCKAVGLLFASGYVQGIGHVGYACAMDDVFYWLYLVTVCRGIYLRALWVRAGVFHTFRPLPDIWRPAPSPGDLTWQGARRDPRMGPVPRGLDDQMKLFDELRHYARRVSEPGRVLVDLATAVIPQIAGPVYGDPIAFGLYVRLMDKFALQPTVLDMLETRIDDEAVDLLHRFLHRLERVAPASRDPVSEIGKALADVRGQRIADLLRVDLGD